MDKKILKTKSIHFIDTHSVNLYYFYVNEDSPDKYDDEINYIFRSLSLIGLNELKKKIYSAFIDKWCRYIELQEYSYASDVIIWINVADLGVDNRLEELYRDISKLYNFSDPLNSKNSLNSHLKRSLKANEICVVLDQGKILFCLGAPIGISVKLDGIKEDLLKAKVVFSEHGYFETKFGKIVVKYLHVNEINESYRWYEKI